MKEAENEAHLKHSAVIDEVRAARARQDAQCGEQNHSPITWVVIAVERLGESAEQALRMQTQRGTHGTLVAEASDRYRASMLRLAAVACAAWECSVYGSAPAPDAADRNSVLELVALNLERYAAKTAKRPENAEHLDPVTQVCGVQYLLGSLAGYAIEAAGLQDALADRVHDGLIAIASAAANAVVSLDLGKWAWDTAHGPAT